MAEAKILVASEGKDKSIKVMVSGRATFRCSQTLRSFFDELLSRKVFNFKINLSECEGMDSTFMGVLATVGIPCAQNKTPVTIVNAGIDNRKLLDGLGVSKLFDFSDGEEQSAEWSLLDQSTSGCAKIDKDLSTVMLEAHETLNNVDPSNIKKFKDVIEFLKEDLKKFDED